jgi:hypothetical protein
MEFKTFTTLNQFKTFKVQPPAEPTEVQSSKVQCSRFNVSDPCPGMVQNVQDVKSMRK